MLFKRLISDILFYVSVPTCVCCKTRLERQDNVFCPKCYADFEQNMHRECSRCFKTLDCCQCSSRYLSDRGVKRVVKVFRYGHRNEDAASNSIIYSLKQDNRRDVIELTSDILASAIRNSFSDFDGTVITNIPRRKSAILRYGFDHAARLASRTADKLGAEYLSLLSSDARSAQKAGTREERRKNAKFSLKHRIDLFDKRVIIIDDIITTGSSIGAAATLLKSLHPKEIAAASLAIAYKDEYTPLQYIPFR